MFLVVVIAALAVALLLYGVMIYNNLVGLKHAVAQAWSNIDVLLKQRHDELPKLVEVCKQSMHFEQETLDRVIRARQQVQEARAAQNVGALGRAEGALHGSMARLFAVAESYPDLKTNEASVICRRGSAAWRRASRTGASSTTQRSTPTMCASSNSPTCWLRGCSALTLRSSLKSSMPTRPTWI